MLWTSFDSECKIRWLSNILKLPYLVSFFYTHKKTPSTQKPRRRTSTQRPLKTTFEDIPGRRTINTKRPINQRLPIQRLRYKLYCSSSSDGSLDSKSQRKIWPTPKNGTQTQTELLLPESITKSGKNPANIGLWSHV